MAINDSPLEQREKRTSIAEAAARIALSAHAGQVRKDDGSPYIIHPFMVALMLARHGFTDTVVAAGLAHDILEDSSITQDELERLLGQDVVRIILPLTEDKTLVWEERKKEYIANIRLASIETKAVCVADKIHNLESVLSAHALLGPRVWDMFNRGKDQKTWFEHAVLSALQETWPHSLVEEYASLVARLDTLE